MLGADQRTLQALGHERDERFPRAAEAQRHIRMEVVVARRIATALTIFSTAPSSSCRAAPAGVVSAAPQADSSNVPAPPPVRERVRIRGHEPESIGRAGDGERMQLAAARTHA